METYTFEKGTEKYTTITYTTKAYDIPMYKFCTTSKRTTVKAKSFKDAKEMVSKGDCQWKKMGGKKSNYEEDY